MSARDRRLEIVVDDAAGTVLLKITTYARGWVDNRRQVTFSRREFERALRDADITLPLRVVNSAEDSAHQRMGRTS